MAATLSPLSLVSDHFGLKTSSPNSHIYAATLYPHHDGGHVTDSPTSTLSITTRQDSSLLEENAPPRPRVKHAQSSDQPSPHRLRLLDRRRHSGEDTQVVTSVSRLNASLLREDVSYQIAAAPRNEGSGNTGEGTSHESNRRLSSHADSVFHRPSFIHLGTKEPPQDLVIRPFQKWLKNLKQQRQSHVRCPSSTMSSDIPGSKDNLIDNKPVATQPSMRASTDTADSSSQRFVSEVRSATVTAVATSIIPKSWFGNRLSHLRRNRTSGSYSGSTEHTASTSEPWVDERACARAVKRRRVLEELIESEEIYIADLKILMYSTLLPHTSLLHSRVKASVQETLDEMLQMHEEILAKLYDIVPNAEYNHRHAKEPPTIVLRGHIRWHSADSVTTRFLDMRLVNKLRHSLDNVRRPREFPIAATAAPGTGLAVAQLFALYMGRFSVYEEFAAQYELISLNRDEMAIEGCFEQGIELLSRILESDNSRTSGGKKGLTYYDLVIKPIQRFCKYPLLFADLAKNTPVCDDPDASAALLSILSQLRDAVQAMNNATNGSQIKRMMSRTWLLHERLIVNGQPPSVQLSRCLGCMRLCGVLHVAWQSKRGIRGHYMMCVLFNKHLLLACARTSLKVFQVVACIPAANMSVEEPDNGHGLQSHAAPQSWKISFVIRQRLYELIFSACSPVEESQWRHQLGLSVGRKTSKDQSAFVASQTGCILALDIKSVATLYGRDVPPTHRNSMRRAATLGTRAQISHVIIQDTMSGDIATSNSSDTNNAIGRSRSLLSQHQLPLLAPARMDRIQLELAISDLWTKELLPFPGMKLERPESSLRTSATVLMRKLSMASITSNFSRRSSNLSSNRSLRTDLPFPSVRGHRDGQYDNRERAVSLVTPSPARAQQPVCAQALSSAEVVNFQQTPEKFLPPDFEVPEVKTLKLTKKKSLQPLARDIPTDVPSTQGVGNIATVAGTEGRRQATRKPSLYNESHGSTSDRWTAGSEAILQNSDLALGGTWKGRVKQFRDYLL